MKFMDKTESSGKDFVKLKDKESIRGLFKGDIFEFRQHWKDNKGVVCIGHACPMCALGIKPGFRFRLNFLQIENDALVCKIFEQGWTVYLTLKSLHEGGYDLEKYWMKITRHGASKSDTTYSIVPVPNGAVTPEQEIKILAVPLMDLKHPKPESVEDVPHIDEDIPF